MKTLIIGKYDYLISFLEERLYKEGHEIHIIDEFFADKIKSLNAHHKIYNFSLDSYKVTEILKEYNFDLMIYSVTSENDNLGSINNIIKNINKRTKIIFLFDNDLKKSELLIKYFELLKNEAGYDIHILMLPRIINFEDINNEDEMLSSKDECMYAGDVIDAIYKMYERGKSFLLNISDQDNKTKEELKWQVKYTKEQGLNRIKEYYIKQEKKLSANKKVNKYNMLIKKYIIPIFENVLLAIITYLLNDFFIKNSISLPINISFIYIAIIALTYGIGQTSISIILSIISSILLNINQGKMIVSILYDGNTFISFALYTFAGVMLSYVIDNKKEKIKELSDEKNIINDKLEFIYDRYKILRKSKKSLEEQILNKEDSLIALYNIIKEINTLNPSVIFDKSASVVSDIMKCKEVSIHVRTKSEKYLRLVSQTGDYHENVNKSINLNDHKILNEELNKGNIYINTDFDENLPIMMCPVRIDEKDMCVIGIWDIEFEELTIYKKNLLKVLSYLIKDSFGIAYIHEKTMSKQKYVDNTIILKSKYFNEIMSKKKALNNILLLVEDYEYQSLIDCIRNVDILGMSDKGILYLLLTNISEKDLEKVITRLKDKNIATRRIKKITDI